MAYRQLGTETGTEQIKCRIHESLVEYINEHGLVLNAVVNNALRDLIRDIQTDRYKPTWQMQQGNRASRWHGDKLIAKGTRIRRDLLDYLRINAYNVNGSVNAALSRQIAEWQAKEKSPDFRYPTAVLRDRAAKNQTTGRLQNVCLNPCSGNAIHPEPTTPDVIPDGNDIQNNKVRYLGDPCKHAKFIEGLTQDMCGHCEYFDHTITDQYESYCLYHGKR